MGGLPPVFDEARQLIAEALGWAHRLDSDVKAVLDLEGVSELAIEYYSPDSLSRSADARSAFCGLDLAEVRTAYLSNAIPPPGVG